MTGWLDGWLLKVKRQPHKTLTCPQKKGNYFNQKNTSSNHWFSRGHVRFSGLFNKNGEKKKQTSKIQFTFQTYQKGTWSNIFFILPRLLSAHGNFDSTYRATYHQCPSVQGPLQELTNPTLGKGKSSSKLHLIGYVSSHGWYIFSQIELKKKNCLIFAVWIVGGVWMTLVRAPLLSSIETSHNIWQTGKDWNCRSCRKIVFPPISLPEMFVSFPSWKSAKNRSMP